ncbi:MAG TPA: ketoacyl-synthetase C-terminal extension domain-containing protein, partial [Ramlibacter sp.]
YVEAHGTGTSLGDPVEINGLKGAFEDSYRAAGLPPPAAPHCTLGTVKANIGHLEAAAGATGLVKVLLMLRHRRIPGNAQLRQPNPYLQLEGTPFVLARDTQDWRPAMEGPLRAGVSSFGVGGSNAHVLVQEPPPPAPVAPAQGTALIVLSARDATALHASAQRLLDFVRKEAPPLHALAWTLQGGREAMGHRLAFAAESLAMVEERLQLYLAQGAGPAPGLHVGAPALDGRGAWTADEDFAGVVSAWIAKGKHDALLAAWVDGFAVDWRLLHATPPPRIGLPTYPFARERYWVPSASAPMQVPAPAAERPPQGVLAYEERWVEQALVAAPADRAHRVLCFLSDRGLQAEVLSVLARIAPRARVDFVRRPPSGGADAVVQALSGLASADAALFLWPWEDRALAAEPFQVVAVLQALARTGLLPARMLLSGAAADSRAACDLDAWLAFPRSLRQELPATELAVVYADGEPGALSAAWIERLWNELGAGHLASARYRDGRREVPQIRRVALAEAELSPLRQGGCYLVTGGCGGLGFQLARHLARGFRAQLV